MAALTGTASSYSVGSAGGLREDLEDVIWDLFADDTYCLTNFERTGASGVYHEWEGDTLGGVTANRQLEGDDPAYTTAGAPSRYGNYNQISRKEFLVSGTLDVVKKAGRKSEVARLAMKKMRELKNDMEYAIVRNQASSAGGAATARSSAGMESWIPGTQAVLATTTASATTPGFSAGTVAAPTDGTTTGALTEAAFVSALGLAWSTGGTSTTVLCSSAVKKTISAFAGIAALRSNVKQGKEQASIIGAADYYVSDYGGHSVVLHRHVRTSVALCIDPEYWSIAFLRKPFMEPLAKTGDAEKRQMLAEFCLVARNPIANSKVVAIA